MQSISDLIKAIDSLTLDEFELAIQSHPSLLTQPDADGRKCLHHVISSGRYELLEWLLSNQPNLALSEQDEDGWTPLHIAACKKRPDIVQKLIQKAQEESAVDPKSMDDFLHSKTMNGQTALHYAVSKKDAKSMDILLEAGARVNAKDAFGQTPLHRAATVGCSSEMLTRLVRGFPGQIYAVDLQGDSPLHLAIENGHTELAKFMIAHLSPDLTLQNKSDESPADVAKKLGLYQSVFVDHQKL